MWVTIRLQSLRNASDSLARIRRLRTLFLHKGIDLLKVILGLVIRSGLIHDEEGAIGFGVQTWDSKREGAIDVPFARLAVRVYRDVALDAEIPGAHESGVGVDEVDLQPLEFLDVSSAQIGGVDVDHCMRSSYRSRIVRLVVVIRKSEKHGRDRRYHECFYAEKEKETHGAEWPVKGAMIRDCVSCSRCGIIGVVWLWKEGVCAYKL